MAPKKQLFGNRSFVGSSATIESIMEEDRVIRPRKYGELRRQERWVPRACDCGVKVLVHTSNDPPTRGMRFLHCLYEISRGLREGCGFMRDWNEAIQDEFDKVREHNAALKKALEEAIEKIEDLDIRVSASEDDGTLEHVVKEEGLREGCGFMRDWNEAIQDEFDKVRGHNAALKKALEEAIEKIEDLDIRVSASEDDGILEHVVKDANWKLKAMTEKYEEAIDKSEDLDILLTEKHEELAATLKS